jgi:hypothetical protein
VQARGTHFRLTRIDDIQIGANPYSGDERYPANGVSWGTVTTNDNLGPTTLGTVNATNGCGRGFYSTTNSQNTTISTVNASNCTGIGIWLGSVSKNVRVNGGVLRSNAGGCWADSNPAGSGNVLNVSCQ